MTFRARALFAACLTGVIGFAGAASGAVIRTQQPCAGEDGYCLRFFDGDPIPVIRTFTFNAPRAGQAAVSFHGSLVCSSGISTNKVVDFVTQIVSNNAAPVLDGPGALRLAAVLVGSSLGTSTTFNLASKRVFNISAGGQRMFRFKITALRMDADTFCFVYNATFTVQFAP